MNEPHDKPLRILFVCLANLCRSPMAEAIVKSLYGGMIEAQSAGISPGEGPIFPETEFILKGLYGASLPDHKPRHVLEFSAEDFDYIIAMDSSVFIRLSEMKTIPKDKLCGWEIADPCGLGIESYEQTARKIELNMEALLEKLDEENNWSGRQA